MMKKTSLSLAFLSPLCLLAQIGAPQFIVPIQGAYLQDFYIVNYVDWGLNGIQDHHCGNKTYDGHQGTDFVIRNFAQMDAGVDVFAADTGVVTFRVDTLFDRNKTAVSGGLGNYVAIRHFNNLYTYYGHLKKESVTVQVGDTVVRGQKIGQVGSSGFTSDPHLHFEVWEDSLFNRDPFAGPCGNTGTLWLDTLPYVDHFGIIDHDFCHFNPTLDTLKERLQSQTTFSVSDTAVAFWMQGYGVFPGDLSTVRWLDPAGDLWYQFDYVHTSEWWYYYFWSYIHTPPADKAGLWTVQYLLNNDLKIVDTFTVSGTSVLLEPGKGLNIRVYQNTDGDLVLQGGQPIPSDDEIYIVDMMGVQVYYNPVKHLESVQTIRIPHKLSNGMYVLYDKAGVLKPQRFVFVR